MIVGYAVTIFPIVDRQSFAGKMGGRVAKYGKKPGNQEKEKKKATQDRTARRVQSRPMSLLIGDVR